MSHSNPSHRQRKAARAYAAQHGVSYQTAVQRLQAVATRPRQRPATEAALLRRVHEWLDGEAGHELEELVRQRVNDRGVVMDEFTPRALVEGNIEEATLSTFAADGAPVVEDAYLLSGKGEALRYGVNVAINGDGDVDWYVSAPTGGDVQAFGDAIEGYEHGGGLLQECDGAVPVRIFVSGAYVVETRQWIDVEVDFAAIRSEEAELRARRHAAEEFRRLQALGLEPSDDELEAMSEGWAPPLSGPPFGQAKAGVLVEVNGRRLRVRR